MKSRNCSRGRSPLVPGKRVGGALKGPLLPAYRLLELAVLRTGDGQEFQHLRILFFGQQHGFPGKFYRTLAIPQVRFRTDH